MEVQEGNNQAEEAVDPEPRRVLSAQPSSTPNRDMTSTCSDDWTWSGEPEDQWEQCPIDIPVRMGAEMSNSQGYTLTSDDAPEDASESNPSSCISATSNPMRKRAFSESATQTTPRMEERRGTRSSGPDDSMEHPRPRSATNSRRQKKDNKGDTPTTIPLLCNLCWCHWCQRPSEYCGPFSCTCGAWESAAKR
jgi:hypothetical protein